MKKIILGIITTLLFMHLGKAQTLINVYAKQGKIFVKYSNGKSKEIVSKGTNSELAFLCKTPNSSTSLN